VLGTLLCSVTTLMYAYVHSVIELLIVRTLNGAFSSFITPVAGAYIATIAPKNKLGEYMGLFSSSIGMGFATGPLIGGVLAKWFGIRSPFYFCSALAFIAFVLSYIKLKNVRVNNEGRCEYVNKNILYEKVSTKNKFSLEYITKSFLIAYGINTTYMSINTGIMVYLAVYATKYGVGLDLVGFLIAFTNLVMGLLQRRFGRIYDKIGMSIVYGGLLTSSIGLYLLSLSHTFIMMLISLTLVSIGGAMFGPGINALAMSDVPNNKKGSAMGLFTTSLNIGMFLGAVFLGYVADMVGLSKMYQFSSILIVAVLIIVVFLTIRKNK